MCVCLCEWHIVCVYMCVHVCVYVCICVTNVFIVCVYELLVCDYMCISVYLYVWCPYMHGYLFVCDMSMCVHVCIYMCMYGGYTWLCMVYVYV